MDRFMLARAASDAVLPMELDELLSYIRNINDFTAPPWKALVTQIESMGDPAVPNEEQSAILRWLGESLEAWEEQYPLEEPLAAKVRELKPLAAMAAVLDSTFMQPGAHPVHRLIDSLQARAIGWHPRLQRAGKVLEQQVHETVNAAKLWMDDNSTDLNALCEKFEAATERDQSRARRMVQRVVETEIGKVKTLAAKQEAARVINAVLEKYPAPRDIGEFVKGPWFASAQLLLLKFGADSEQWRTMATVTDTLMDSLQSLEDADEQRRQYIFQLVTQLPKEMRRWLLSLHHDTEAVNDAMGLVEHAHLRILRRQELELVRIEPISINESGATETDPRHSEALEHWQEGQWFSIEQGAEGALRAQMILKSEEAQQVLFCNMAGIKVLQLSFADFLHMLLQDKAVPLNCGASFSTCLAVSAGIRSAEMAEALTQTQLGSRAASRPAPAEPAVSTEAPTDSADIPADSADTLAQSTGTTAGDRDHPAGDSPFGVDLDLDTDFDDFLADLAEKENFTLEGEFALGDSAAAPAPEEAPGGTAPDTQGDADEAPAAAHAGSDDGGDDDPTRDGDDTHPDLRSLAASGGQAGSSTGYLTEPSLYDRDRFIIDNGDGDATDAVDDAVPGAGAAPAPAQPQPVTTELTSAVQGFLSEQAALLQRATVVDTAVEEEEEEEPDALPAEDAAASPSPAADAAPDTIARGEIELDIPMGTWLGFHDSETPTMARLAVRDPQNDYYIFVNRKGVKLRQDTKADLLALIEAGLVEILEIRSDFREEVMRLRDGLDD